MQLARYYYISALICNSTDAAAPSVRNKGGEIDSPPPKKELTPQHDANVNVRLLLSRRLLHRLGQHLAPDRRPLLLQYLLGGLAERVRAVDGHRCRGL